MSLERAEKFAEQMNSPEVYTVLGVAQLQQAQADLEAQQPLQVIINIQKGGQSLIRARCGDQYRLMITTVFSYCRVYAEGYPNEVTNAFLSLIEYLRGARTVMFVSGKYAEHAEIDTGLMYCYVKLDKLEELESFLQLCNAIGSGIVPNKGDIQQIGDRAYSEQKYVAAKMLFHKIENWAKLALTYLKL